MAGAMTARALASYCLSVCILEKGNDVALGASRANSGIVHAGYDAREGTLKARLNVRGSEIMEPLARELGVPYRRNGSLVTGFTPGDRDSIGTLYARGVKNGVRGLRILDGTQARQMEPGLSEKVTCALYAPSAAIICPYELTIAAVGNAMDNGVELLTGFQVTDIKEKDGFFEILSASGAMKNLPDEGGDAVGRADSSCGRADSSCGSTDNLYDRTNSTYGSTDGPRSSTDSSCGSTDNPYDRTNSTYGNTDSPCGRTDNPCGRTNSTHNRKENKIYARYVVNAAGVHADEIARMAGDFSFRIHPRRGEYMLLDRECGNLVSHTLFRTPSEKGKGVLITPTVDGNLLLGPTSQDLEDRGDTSVTAEGLEWIRNSALETLSSVPFHKTITSFCGLRAVGDTGDFILTSPRPGFINAAGIESPGLSAAPAIAETVVEMLADQGLPLRKKEDWNPIRRPAHAFRSASLEEKNRIIRRDKTYGRVVCRCETVTEGEILEAIRQNPPARDLDSVKRRTRAQMGRCQGGFCMPHIAELLSRELDIPFEQVTKSGAGSEIIVGRTKEIMP